MNITLGWSTSWGEVLCLDDSEQGCICWEWPGVTLFAEVWNKARAQNRLPMGVYLSIECSSVAPVSEGSVRKRRVTGGPHRS